MSLPFRSPGLAALRRWSIAAAWPFAAALVAVLVTGCGGGGVVDAGAPSSVVVEPAGPGRLIAVSALPAVLAPAIAASAAAVPAIVPRYSVANYRVEYLTTDADGREIRASGLMSVPIKGIFARSPVLSYQHATIFDSAEAPSEAITADAPPVVMASLGYLVVAADYVGYGASKGAPHPYLLASPSAASVVDLLTASRTWRERSGVRGNGQLFLAGYSEGGYVTVASQRSIEAGDSVHRGELVDVVAGAGPYDVNATLDGLLQIVKEQSPILAALLDPGFLRLLSDDARNDVRRRLVGLLAPADGGIVFDTRFIDAYMADDRTRVELQSNVHDWKPVRPLALFHGRDDRTVPYVASTRALAAMRSRGAGNVTLTDCTTVPAGHLTCVPEFLGFLVQRLQQRATDL